MGITTEALHVAAALFAGSSVNPTHIAVGTGSSTFQSGNTTLLDEFDRNFIDTYNLDSPEQVTYTANWSPTDISGAVLTEFGAFTSGNSMINREVIADALTFDGESELQIQETIKFSI